MRIERKIRYRKITLHMSTYRTCCMLIEVFFFFRIKEEYAEGSTSLTKSKRDGILQTCFELMSLFLVCLRHESVDDDIAISCIAFSFEWIGYRVYSLIYLKSDKSQIADKICYFSQSRKSPVCIKRNKNMKF